MIARRNLIGASALALFGASLSAQPRTPGKVVRIGWLSPQPLDTGWGACMWDAFRVELEGPGRVEERDVVFERRSADAVSRAGWPAGGAASEFELATNLTTAKAQGFTIPQQVLLCANKVIE